MDIKAEENRIRNVIETLRRSSTVSSPYFILSIEAVLELQCAANYLDWLLQDALDVQQAEGA